jgi:AcrR family transcriptional regulator
VSPTRIPRRTQAERRAASERKLLDATAVVIGERRTSSVTFADIAREAGCSHSLPGYIFGSKTNLLLALIDDAQARFRELVMEPAVAKVERSGGGHLDALVKVVETFVRSLDAPWRRTRALNVLMGEAGGAPPELREALIRHNEAGRELFAGLIRAAQENGEVRGDVDPAAHATILVAALRGLGQQVMLDPSAASDVAELTREVVVATRRALERR